MYEQPYDLPGADVDCPVPADAFPQLAGLAIRLFKLNTAGDTTFPRRDFQIARYREHYLWHPGACAYVPSAPGSITFVADPHSATADAIAALTDDGRELTLEEYVAALQAVLDQPTWLPEPLRAALHGPETRKPSLPLARTPAECRDHYCELAAGYVDQGKTIVEACKRAARDVPDDYAHFHPTLFGTTDVRRAAYEAVRQFLKDRGPRA